MGRPGQRVLVVRRQRLGQAHDFGVRVPAEKEFGALRVPAVPVRRMGKIRVPAYGDEASLGADQRHGAVNPFHALRVTVRIAGRLTT